MKIQLLSLVLTLVLVNNVYAIAEGPVEKNLSLEQPASEQSQQPHQQIIPTSRGELLYLNHCQGCHESKVHIREKQKAKNINEIRSEVFRWAQELELKWTLRDIEDVVEYLNHVYYHHTD